MRVNFLMVGAAVLFAACGGGDADTDQQPAAGTDTPAAEAPAATGTGTTHDVQMVLEGTEYKYVPEQLTVKPGDRIRYINVSGGPHNVAFWADSIPAGAEASISQAMGETMGPLQGVLLVEPNAEYVLNLPASTPTGDYGIYCTPHLAMGMTQKLTVAQ
jgi:plastocyanin